MDKSEYVRIEKEAPPKNGEKDREDSSCQPGYIIGIEIPSYQSSQANHRHGATNTTN
jgi:hypothetical protein